jgi:hypothetical protein
MRRMLGKFCGDERGSLLLTDWLFLATILMIGVLPALLSVRENVSRAVTKPARSWSIASPSLGAWK